MLTFTSQIALVLLLLLYATTFHTSMSSNHKVVRCNDKDRGTLLIFKKGIIDPSDHLSTWSTEEDCCAWKGVHCDNITGRVLKLDLKHPISPGEEPYKGLKGYLNLSCNNFIGRIPTGTQLQSFNASSYIENPKLCGAPLKNCSVEEKNPKSSELPEWNEDGDPLIKSLYLGMGVGFAVGFWGICGSLFLIRKWRHTCFRFLDLVTDQLYVTLMVKLNRFCEIWARTA